LVVFLKHICFLL